MPTNDGRPQGRDDGPAPGADPAGPGAPRQSGRARVHTELRARITSLRLPPGSPLSENELAAALDVSRTPVREALILLAEEGLVEVFPKLGSFVSRISVPAVLESQFVREAIEVAALRVAVERADDAALAALRDNLARQRAACADDDAQAFWELDEEFHRTLMEASGHRTLWRTVTTAKAHLDRARRLSLPLPQRLRDLTGEHTAVVDALADRDAPRAEETLRAHLQGVFDDIQTIRARSPELFESDTGPVTPVRRRVHPRDRR
ncbi:GntR family transcriptional regulator [Streptomyces sp. NPDC059740]|uniref:GntR family transcriptional regulator n=1 Tax=Streptomyces sp. NPDC059740 TaxID=3346926 RepID=UPI00364FD68F